MTAQSEVHQLWRRCSFDDVASNEETTREAGFPGVEVAVMRSKQRFIVDVDPVDLYELIFK